MRKSSLVVGIGALAAVSYAAIAADPLSVSPESRAYLDFKFGGSADTRQELHYGLRFSQTPDAAYYETLRPSTVITLDYSNVGKSLLVNGRPLIERTYRLNQAEGEAAAAAAPAEEPGFFGKVGNFFSNLWPFGGEEAPAGEAGAAEAGFFDNYTVADYALLGVGVIGVGYAITEVADSEDDNPPAASGGTGGGGTTGGTLGLPGGLPGGTTGGGTTGGTLGLPGLLGFSSSENGRAMTSQQRVDYQSWLDGGTGQMGDLVVR